MAWESRNGKGRYYTRSIKVNGRVRRQYIGTGAIGELAAAMDALRQARRQAEREARWAEQERWAAAEVPIADLCRGCELMLRARLVLDGYYRHDYGRWRLRSIKS